MVFMHQNNLNDTGNTINI